MTCLHTQCKFWHIGLWGQVSPLEYEEDSFDNAVCIYIYSYFYNLSKKKSPFNTPYMCRYIYILCHTWTPIWCVLGCHSDGPTHLEIFFLCSCMQTTELATSLKYKKMQFVPHSCFILKTWRKYSLFLIVLYPIKTK